MRKKISFCRADIGRKEIRAVKKVLKSGWLTTGKVTKQFEEEFAGYVGSKYAIAVSSATVGLELSLRYLNLQKSDLVLVPSFTFCATAQAVENAGGSVIFGDINDKTLCLDNNSFLVKNSLKMVKAVVPVHLGGNKAYTNYQSFVIEDSAHRIIRNQCKNNPNAVVFSFYPTKNMTCGEGGMVATNDKEFYEWLLKARSHGRNKLVGHGYEVEFTGWKANLPDVLSAIGLVQLRKLDKMNIERKRIIDKYNEAFGTRWEGLHLYPVFVDRPDDFVAYMNNNGVQCSRHFQSLHKMSGFKKHNKFKLPITETLSDKEVSLPVYPKLKNKEVDYIIKLVKEYAL